MGILDRNKKTALQLEWETMQKKELKIASKHESQTDTKLNEFLKDKVPDKLQSTLDVAFAKAFKLVFNKGTSLIEKTYDKEKMEQEHKIDLYADSIKNNRKSLKKFSKKASKGELVNVALSGASGIGMGLIGVGIPDIPVFTGIMLKSIYEIALRYGYDYDNDDERYFILLLIEAAMTYGEEFEKIELKIDDFIRDEKAPEGTDISEQIEKASKGLSKELLYMKFVQGIPVVGTIGGAYDIAYIKKISEYARVKYKKRFLIKWSKNN